MLEEAFARQYLDWRGIVNPTGTNTALEQIVACARLLELDLLCLSPRMTATDTQGRLASEMVAAVKAQNLFVFWLVDGAFQRLMEKWETLKLMAEIARTPEKVGAMMAELAEEVKNDIRLGITAGAHGIMIADDIAYQRSTYIAPVFIERFLAPLWREQIDLAPPGRIAGFSARRRQISIRCCLRSLPPASTVCKDLNRGPAWRSELSEKNTAMIYV